VLSVAFSPDGVAVLTGSDDGFARLWDARTWRPLAPPWKHSGPVHAVSILPDKRLLTASGKMAFLRRFPDAVVDKPEALTERVERSTGLVMEADGTIRVLTGAEWARR
jgi:WD40 repeat protein